MHTLWQDEQDALTSQPTAMWPFGARLSPAGWAAYPSLFSEAVESHDMGWLALQLRRRDYWDRYAFQSRRTGPVRITVNPDDEAAKLAYGEFNIAYVRGVLTVAADEGLTVCTIVRAGAAAAPRWECSCMEGAVVSSEAILAGHRAYTTGRGSEISIPSRPNCHHTVYIPQWAAEQVA
jgi:hypothetical protein